LISDTNGSVAHCKIKNMLANGVAQQYFDRQWYCEDPSGIMLMTESAPLVIPSNKNGVVCGTGFITIRRLKCQSTLQNNPSGSLCQVKKLKGLKKQFKPF
jgi:hypothetical protein